MFSSSWYGTGIKISLLVALVYTCSACTFFREEDEVKRRGYLTLADLKKPKIKRRDINPVPRVSLDELEESYRATLTLVNDPALRHKIELRLVDIEMARAEQEQIDGVVKDRYFEEAIAFYEQMLEKNTALQDEPGTPTNERLLYRLSKAYALDGQLEESDRVLARLVEEFPESPYRAEADFRQAELAFSNQQYTRSESLYARVIEIGDGTPFYKNAVYMHGWSRFKQNRYKASIPSFTEVLDITLVEGQSMEELGNSQRSLAEDTLRILSIVFSYLDGPKTITEVYAKLGERHYQHNLYSNLGDFYLEQNRFRDSADTFLAYVEEYPETDYSPDFSVKAIEVFELGNYPSLILPAKEAYVTNYGIQSNYWQTRDEATREKLRPFLRTYIDELASHYHAKAYDLQKLNQEYLAQQKSTQPIPDEQRIKKQPDSPNPDFLRAAELYREYMLTFPDDEQTAELVYFMGEAFYEAGRYEEAVDAYEIVAYRYLDESRGAEAGYSAIIAMQRLVKITEGEKQAHWSVHKIDSSISYSKFYSDDDRAVGVLTAAAEELFDNGELEKAMLQAERVTSWDPAPPHSLLVTSWLILSHSHFELGDFVKAEAAYRTLLPLLEETDPQREQVIERIAASMYKQSEQQVADGLMAEAVETMLNIRLIAPNSEIAMTAQYDAANYLIDLQQWQRAETELLDFQTKYPGHELTKTLPPKFVFLYQESEQWEKAAEALDVMVKSDPSPEVQRQSLYLSAELFEKSGKPEKAIGQYRKYANTYPRPFNTATEARFRLVELYGERNDPAKRDFWLRKLIEEHDRAGDAQNQRSRYLAAFAAAKFANDDYNAFKRVKLTLPLKQSLKRKKQAMDTALKGYKRVMGYGVAEFTTEASNNIGEIYATLSSDLIDSERPAGLDELALEQYEILIEEQAYPFEEKAIEIHENNAQRAWTGIYDDWVKESFANLAKLLPARYGKKESVVEFSDGLH